MRERTTWNREEIAKRASAGHSRVAEDPRAMNQDHLSQQPKADAYDIGGPSEFGEDVSTKDSWKEEQSGGSTKRNEIGMPEFRSDTWKTAGLDKEALEKKADLAVQVAEKMLKSASQDLIEDQALALMSLSDADLINTANRLAGVVTAEDESEQDEDKDDAKEQQAEDKGQGQQQAKQASEMQQMAAQALQALQQGDVQSAQQQLQALCQQQMASGQGQDQVQAMVQSMLQSAMQQMQAQQPQQQQGQQGQQQAQAQQVQQQVAQQQGQQAQAQQVQQQMAQQQEQLQAQQQEQMAGVYGDDQMLDQLLQDELGMPQQVYADNEIQLEGASMDVGETKFAAEDDVLRTLFANNAEVQQAAQAMQIQTGVGPSFMTASVPSVRTASTRTVGTRPTQGVSQLGGAASGGASGGEIDKLAGLWASAPNVKDVFGS